jgi:organic radical activating enzyme
MKIHNIRYGFATNSSSTHSIIISKENDTDFYDEDAFDHYGWNDFTLASPEAKRHYLTCMLDSNITRSYGQTNGKEYNGIIRKIANSFSGNREKLTEIDRQSNFNFPKEFNDRRFPHKEFFKEYLNYIINNNQILILGGNDNSDGHDLRRNSDDETIFDFLDNNNVTTCRYDKEYNFWSIFDRSSGHKIRFSFDNNITITKSSAPELVDLKITNYCNKNCEYCYQNSNTSGQHADFEDIKKIIDILADHEVFEIAIGGGEPTLHPNFIDIIEYCYYSGITPNFTTNNYEFIMNTYRKDLKELFKFIGAFAVTINNAQELKKIQSQLNLDYYSSQKVTYQIVMGIVTEKEYKDILNQAKHSTITLLGFKENGRGKDFNKIDYSWLGQDLIDRYEDKYKARNIGVDTVIAKQFDKEFIAGNIDKRLYDTKEGKFSCYIDAIDMKIGPSSFCQDDEMKDFNSDTFLEDFKNF